MIIQIWNKNKCLKTGVWDLFFQHFKKGDKTECLNYRGIMLLNVAHKYFFFTVLARKLSLFPEEIPGEYQCGFCPGRSSTEQLFILRQSLEKWYEYGIDVNTPFIDYKLAFDSIDKYKLLTTQELRHSEKKLINLIKMIVSQTCSNVMGGNHASQSFHVGAVVRQGDALLSTLCNPLNPELNPICYLLALLAHHFLHVSRIRVKSLTLRLLMSYIYMERLFLMFLDHTQRRSTVGRTPLDE